jgi:hypothetical protein
MAEEIVRDIAAPGVFTRVLAYRSRDEAFLASDRRVDGYLQQGRARAALFCHD